MVAVAAHYVTNTFGMGSEAFIDFGLAEPTVTAQTVETKVLAVQKRAGATAWTRHRRRNRRWFSSRASDGCAS